MQGATGTQRSRNRIDAARRSIPTVMLFKDGQKMDTVCAITPEFQSHGFTIAWLTRRNALNRGRTG